MKFPNKSFAFIALSILTMFFISCKSDDDNPADECEEAICTHNIVSIDVRIKDQNQEPVALDSFEVTNIENGEDLTMQIHPDAFVYHQESGQYPMISDGQVQLNQVIDIQFKGFINDIEVISSDYKVTADCCHVALVSGDTNLVLE
ncbi:hypothetical protein OS188_06595 [Xanthomarina sp. F1114]|uniref:hypothetical protein n=1 Tax=Xanthomarina sp. F1114 TaxID=2996019 RepID=UPI00225E5B0B|nr:hypothetical protein [Xanthomarina sp. F1114]MCX7547620.1 hypothetical protein [Xanthomarina sp. F1114]